MKNGQPLSQNEYDFQLVRGMIEEKLTAMTKMVRIINFAEH